MKYILTTLALTISASVLAAPVATVEYQTSENTTTKADTSIYRVAIKEDLTKTIAVDISTSFAQNDSTKALSQRLEGGLIVSPTSLIYSRLAVGERFSTSGNNSYYSAEAGIKPKIGNIGLKFGFRFREAFDTNNWPTQTERTWRAGASYPILKNTSLNFGYDRTFGDIESRAYIFSVSQKF